MILSRRSFLYGAAGTALAANDTPGILAVGVGSRGTGIAMGAAALGRIVAVADADTAQSDKFLATLAKRQKSVPYAAQDYRRFIDRKDVDAVVVGTPDHWHTRVLIDAVKAGKDVYCEKPLTLTIGEGIWICNAVRETVRVVQVGTQQRSEFKQMFLKAVAIAQSGRLGKKLTATCYIGTGAKGGPFATTTAPATLDWNLWLGQAPMAAYTPERCHRVFRWWLEYSGGKLTDWGAHHVDIAQWALGVDETGPVEIEGQGEWQLGRQATLDYMLGKTKGAALPNGYNTPVTFTITARYANGNTLIVKNGPGNGIQIEGEKSSLWVSREELKGKALDEMDAAGAEWLEGDVVRLYRGGKPVSHMRNFFDCMRDRKRPISDVFTHHRSITTCHMCNIAMLCGRKLKWDALKEDFIGDAEASALVWRRQRAPFAINR